MGKFNNLAPNITLTYKSNEKRISFLDLIITLSERKLKTTIATSVPTLCLFTARRY